MRFIILSTSLIILHTFSACTINQSNNINISRSTSNNTAGNSQKIKDGKCYAKCLISDQFSTKLEKYAIYKGDTTIENVDLDTIEILIHPKSTNWVRKKALPDCVPYELNDCLVWCLIETPPLIDTITTLVDTSQTSNYMLKEIELKLKIKEGGFTEWTEVVCEVDIDKVLIEEIQKSLANAGYYDGILTKKLDAKTKNALAKFQAAKNLPIGPLSIVSLEQLGLEY